MSTREITKKLRAWEAGRPIPRYDTIHHAIVPEPQTLIVSFVRMAGESRPWGIAWGTVDSAPTIHTVPDGRVRDDVAVLCAEFAEDLLAHMRVHNWTYDPAQQSDEPSALRQVWFPNGQHIEMLHQLSYTYSQTKFGGFNRDILQALGRLAGWMFRETSRKGSQHVINASRSLSDAYVFPAQDARTAHLGFQLAWLGTPGGRDARIASAEQAEGLTISTTMDPDIDRGDSARGRPGLADLVDRWQASRRDGNEETVISGAISVILESELRRRWELTARAYRLLMNNDRPVNVGVRALVVEAQSEYWFQHQRLELRLNDPNLGPAFVPHPETDYHGSSAASRYLEYEASDEALVGRLIHDDPELFAEALDSGHAIRGEVTRVRDLGVGRVKRPVWTLQISPDAINRLREGGRLTPFGSPGHEVTVLNLDFSESALDVTLEWTARKTMALPAGLGAKPIDSAWVGEQVAFVTSDAADLTRRRSQRVWSARTGPGAWLTHGRFPPQVVIQDDDGGSDVLLDDVRQIEGGDVS